jgi:DNA-binding transcriptional LysR family regulator
VRKLRGAPRGRPSINTSNAFGIHQLVPALSDFLQRYSEIEVELSFADHVMDLITEYADVAIRAGQVNGLSLRAQKFAEFERIICTAPSFLVACLTSQQILQSMSALSPFHRTRGRFIRARALSF